MRVHRRANVAAQLAVSLFREADEWEAKGDAENARKARDAAQGQLVAAGIDSREAAEMHASERVPFTADEEAQRDADEAASAAASAESDAAAAERQALLDKLNAGTATNAEIQRALVLALGGGSG